MKSGALKDKTVFYNSIVNAIDKQERLMDEAGDDMLKRAERMIIFLKDSLRELRQFVEQNQFITQQEEVDFYKKHSPAILSYIIYYVKVYTLELRTAILTGQGRKRILKQEKNSLEMWAQKNEVFFRYYKSRSTHEDGVYFLRDSKGLHLVAEPGQWLLNDDFITIPSYLVAELLANERYNQYLQQELKFYKRSPKRQAPEGDDAIVWTATKAAATELLYALYSVGAFNKGSAQLRQIASKMEKFLGIDLGNYYRYFLDLRIKKIRTKFLREMLDSTEKRMDEQDENPRF